MLLSLSEPPERGSSHGTLSGTAEMGPRHLHMGPGQAGGSSSHEHLHSGHPRPLNVPDPGEGKQTDRGPPLPGGEGIFSESASGRQETVRGQEGGLRGPTRTEGLS